MDAEHSKQGTDVKIPNHVRILGNDDAHLLARESLSLFHKDAGSGPLKYDHVYTASFSLSNKSHDHTQLYSTNIK